MGKYITVYKLNDLDKIEKIETVDGVVVNEGHENEQNMWTAFTNWWSQHRSTFRETHDSYHSYGTPTNQPISAREWEYHFESDNQGAVPSWDGYAGE